MVSKRSGEQSDSTELMLRRIDEVDERDEGQIIAELAGEKVKEFVYKFPQDGAEVTGLSWIAYKELAIQWGNLKMGAPLVEETDREIRAIVEVTDLVHNVTLWAGTHQPKKMELRTGGIKDDKFAFEKAVSKAQRNALKNILPQSIQRAAIDFFLHGKALPIKEHRGERPQERIEKPRQRAVQAPAQPQKPAEAPLEVVVDTETGEISGVPAFGTKGEALQWFHKEHGLVTTDIQPYFPDGKAMGDLSVDEVSAACQKAVAAKKAVKAER